MASFLKELGRNVPVRGDYDVVVVGGGIAGVAAALAAARLGASVCLIEKENALGGLATLGNVVVYLPLCDNMGRKVVGGLGEELLKAATADGSAQVPACWREDGSAEERTKQRYMLTFNPASYLLELEKLVCDAGVRILYDTRFCDVIRDGNRIAALAIENKSGRSALRCRYVIDASGDADVCARGGEPTVSLNTNVPAGWFYFRNAEGTIELDFSSESFDFHGQAVPKDASGGFSGDDGDQVSDMVLAAHRLARENIARLRRHRKTDAIHPILMATVPCFRMTRRLKGAVELEESDANRWFEDAVGMVGHWRKKGFVYCLPYRSVTAVQTANLAVVGRCVSVGTTGWDITRVIPACAVTGEAAGTAAAMACRLGGVALQELPLPGLQEQLRAQNVIIDPNCLRTIPSTDDS